ncbi:MAG: transcription termination/antitermination protein NusG [Candidatus Acidiferrales bacterium]
MDSETDSHGQMWFALQIRTRWEASTAVLLGGKGYEVFLPTYKTKRRWSGRLKEMSAPLFPGYAFCRFNAQKRLPILVTPGVISIVGNGKVPLPVSESEISAIQLVVTSGMRADPWPFVEIGQPVRIDTEPLMGLEGILIGLKGSHRVVLSVGLLRRSVAVEIDRSCVTPLTGRRTHTAGTRIVARPLLHSGVA